MKRARAAIALAILGVVFAAPNASHVARAAAPFASAISEVTLSRSGCYAACPADDVTFRADGTVAYHGSAHVAKLGRYSGRVTSGAYARIVAAIARAKFFRLPSTFGPFPRESATYAIVVKRGAEPTRIQINDPGVAPRPLRDLAGLLSKFRESTTLASLSPINAVVGRFYSVPTPDREVVVSIGPTDDAVFKDRGYIMDLRERVAQPCNDGLPVSRDPLDSAVDVGAGGAISGDGYTVTRTAGGIRISNAHETIDLKPVQYEDAPDLPLQAATDAQCPTTITIQNDGDISNARPAQTIRSNVDLDLATLAARAHFRCDAKPATSIGVVTDPAYASVDGPPYSITVFPASNLIPGTCKLMIDAGVNPKSPGAPAAAAESPSFYYLPKR